jgi:hypothetical protein
VSFEMQSIPFCMVCRMLKEFVAQTKDNDTADGSSEQQLMEFMMNRYCVRQP